MIKVMFSGIVEALAEVKGIETEKDFATIRVNMKKFPVKTGESVCINGICLTVADFKKGTATFQAMKETLDRTNLGSITEKSRVNIERSLKPSDRIGGHFVFGHVDGTAKIKKVEKGGKYVKMWFACGGKLTDHMIEKGSVAVDGISLTIVDVLPKSFSVALIPHTLKVTTLGAKRGGDSVNIEADMLAKYVKKYVRGILHGRRAGAAKKFV